MKFTLCFILVVFLSLNSIESFAIECPDAPSPKLNFSMKKTKTKFNFSKSIKQLTENNSTASKLGAGWVNEGIMKSKFPNYKIGISMSGMSYPELGKACYWVDEINFYWLFQPTIYIAKEYKKYSCKYNTIIAHERQHVGIDIGILSEYQKHIKQALENVSSKPIATGLVRIGDNENLLPYVEKSIKPIIDKMVKERNKKQSAIDTIEEYKKLANKCK